MLIGSRPVGRHCRNQVFLGRVTTVVIVLAFAMFPLSSAFAQTKNGSAASNASSGSSLDGVLTQMDSAAATFRSAEADFVWDQFQKVVNETDTQKGKVYYRRTSKGDTQMAADIQSPEKKYLVFADGRVRIYQPKIEQVNEYDAGKNRDQFQSFLVLGFGGRGHDLQKQFDVTYGGNEDVDGVKTAKLELSPKAANVKNMFNQIVIWIDPTRGISLKQQFFEPSGDYRIAHYTNIKLNSKIPDDAFKLRTSGNVKTVKGK
jgi:outer membrane lipoprotein-sorting protein